MCVACCCALHCCWGPSWGISGSGGGMVHGQSCTLELLVVYESQVRSVIGTAPIGAV